MHATNQRGRGGAQQRDCPETDPTRTRLFPGRHDVHESPIGGEGSLLGEDLQNLDVVLLCVLGTSQRTSVSGAGE